MPDDDVTRHDPLPVTTARHDREDLELAHREVVEAARAVVASARLPLASLVTAIDDLALALDDLDDLAEVDL